MTERKERGIGFNAEMVRAILREADPKTMTRRVVKFGKHGDHDEHHYRSDIAEKVGKAFPDTRGLALFGCDCDECRGDNTHECVIRSPYGVPGAVLYVRESHRLTPFNRDGERWVCAEYRVGCAVDTRVLEFRWKDIPKAQRNRLRKIKTWGRWRPGRFMYKFLARIWLRVTDVRIERVQEIGRDDVLAEGIAQPLYQGHYGLRDAFAKLWDSINAKRGYGFDTNCWVWVYGLERIAASGWGDDERKST